MDVSGKKILILGGIRQSCEIIKVARKMGVTVYVTDYLDDSPGKKIADKSYMISTTDVDGVIDLIRREKIDGVLTGFTDSMLPWYARICARAQLPCYGTLEQFTISTDKARFKLLCRSFGVSVVTDFELGGTFSNASASDLPYPVLLKPVDNSGGRGIVICHSPAELAMRHQEALSFSRAKQILVERYMDQPEAVLFYLVQDGEIVLAAMADRHMTGCQPGLIKLPVAYTFPSVHLAAYQKTLDSKVIDMFRSIDLQNGLLFIQSFVENEQCIFYEMGYRLTGTMEYKIIERFCGINPLELLIHFSLTGSMTDGCIRSKINPNFMQYGFNVTFLVRPGTIANIAGLKAVRSLDGVIDVVPACVPGETIPESALGTLKQVALRVFGCADSLAGMADLIDRIHSLVRIFDLNGDSLLLDLFDTRQLSGERMA